MADKEVRIDFKTTADTSGAKAAEDALEKVEDAARDADAAADKVTKPGSGDVSPTPLVPGVAPIPGRERVPAIVAEKEAVEDLTDALEDQKAKLDAVAAAEDKVADAAKDAAAEGKKIAIKPDVVPVQRAANSVAALEDELKRLQAELRNVPIGTKQFEVLATQIGATQKRINEAEGAARKLGGTMGRGGNAGMAVLEFSRAFEDAQYGIRGVLNNLPGLIAMLGGSAGLAGVISLVAVAGTQLWEKFGRGAEDAQKRTESVNDALESATKFWGEMSAANLEVLAAQGSTSAARIEGLKKELDFAKQILTDRVNYEKQSAKDNGRIKIALEQLRIAGIEFDLSRSSGETALKLARQREEAVRRIADIEAEVAEQIREQDRIQATQREKDAQDQYTGAGQEVDRLSGPRNEAFEKWRMSEKAVADEMEARRKLLLELTAERDAIRKRLAESDKFAPNEVDYLRGYLKSIEGSIADALGDPVSGRTEKSAGLEARASTAKKEYDLAQKNFTEAATKQNEAADALKSASQALASLTASQAQQRGAEQKTREVQELGTKQGEILQKTGEVENKAASAVEKLMEKVLEAIPNAANDPKVQDAVEKIKKLNEGGLNESEMQEAQTLLAQMQSRIAVDNTARAQVYREIISTFDATKSEIDKLRSGLDQVKRDLKTAGAQLGYPSY